MNLQDYFSTTSGKGVLSTAAGDGRVDAAIYARPHTMDDGTLAFIMRDRLTHRNLTENPYAAYLFMAEGPGYQGLRLFLHKVREDTNPELIAAMTRCTLSPEEDTAKGPKFMVYFQVEKILDLIGGETPAISLV